MHCHTCGVEVHDGQKFCAECGASLRGIADVTGEVPVVRSGDTTRPISIVTTPAPLPSPGTMTGQLTVVEATTPPADRTIELAPAYASPTKEWTTGALPVAETRRARRFRFRALLVLGVLAAIAATIGVLATVVEISADTSAFATGGWKANDFGTNNAVAALLAAGAMVAGGFAWCFGLRWGAGLAGGAGAALAGWAALLLGLAEWPIADAEAAAPLVALSITRDVGYWAVAAAGAIGVLTLLVSLARSGRDGRGGLDPWIAALGAVSVLVAAGGPLIPEGTADWTGNYSSATLGVDLPALFFAGRLVQLGLLVLGGVVGFLLVRRYGLGLAVGSALSAGWMLVTAATDRTTSPIGPAYENPGSIDLQPHAVTVVGFGLLGFFSLVAIVMALLDAER